MIHHLNLSDIHSVPYGDPYDFYHDELSPVLDFVLENKVDILTVAGDLFEKIYRADSTEVIVTMKFVHQLLIICESKDIVVRFIKGTESHDNDQLQLFENYESIDGLDFKIINKPTIEESLPDIHFKYIPEICVRDYDEFYKEFLSVDTDITVFHGLVKGAHKMAEDEKSKIILINPIHLEKHNRLYSVGGHLHTRVFVDTNIWYTGSLTAKNYNDANETKGFDYIIISEVDNSYQVKRIENNDCYKFKTIDMTDKFLTHSKETLRAFFLELSRDKKSKENIRIDVDTSSLNQQQTSNLDFIQVKFRSIFDFKITRENINTDEYTLNEKIKKAKRITNKDIPIEDKVLMVLEENKKKFNLDNKHLDIRVIQDILEIKRE